MGQPVNVVVIGAGKMGLPLACAFASRGANVTACDVSPELVAKINAGEPPFEEPGLPEMLASSVKAGRLRATTDTREAIRGADVVVVLVPVLLDGRRGADLSIIEAISNDIAGALRPGAMVSYETTLPVGTTRRLGKLIAQGGLVAGENFDLVFSPERVKSRLVLKHLFANPKIVGGITPKASARGAEFYKTFLGAPVIDVGTLEAAEFVKLAGMVYRDVNIALANELAAYALAHGLDFEAVRDAANTDGEAALLAPGIGVGGHCTPVYPYFVVNEARQRNIPVPLTEKAREMNERQPERIVERLGDVNGRRVLILGLSFRPGVKEAAYSPAYALRDVLHSRGAAVELYDPLYTEDEIRASGFTPGSIDGQEVIVLNTSHTEYAALDFKALAKGGLRRVVDGRQLWSPEAVRASGVDYIGIAR